MVAPLGLWRVGRGSYSKLLEDWGAGFPTRDWMKNAGWKARAPLWASPHTSFAFLRHPELHKDPPQLLVGFLGLGFDGVQFGDDLGDGPVGFGVAGVDVAAG